MDRAWGTAFVKISLLQWTCSFLYNPSYAFPSRPFNDWKLSSFIRPCRVGRPRYGVYIFAVKGGQFYFQDMFDLLLLALRAEVFGLNITMDHYDGSIIKLPCTSCICIEVRLPSHARLVHPRHKRSKSSVVSWEQMWDSPAHLKVPCLPKIRSLELLKIV